MMLGALIARRISLRRGRRSGAHAGRVIDRHFEGSASGGYV